MTRDRSLDVAVTGMAARFPGGSLTEWWEALKAGRVLTTRFTRDELLGAGVPPERADHPDYVPVRGHLPRADHFDNDLFHISPREAELMDPQSRLMLEVAWAALEDAGRNPRDDSVRTGVYASASGSTYMRAMLTGGALAPAALDQALRGTEPDYLATRIAYKLGLTGPALTVQTACSSSLVALHTAVQALLNGECDQAVVVAAAVDFPQAGHLYVPGGILSASGVCRPFDADADGVVAGSGVVCVVLRPLADVTAEGAAPHGVILGTAINNDGSTKAGYHAPSAAGQEAVIRAALRTADVDASSLGYLEAHATGTRVGDPIEWSAASAALAGPGARPGQVAVGAVKANIGHLDAAAGLASLVKALLVVKEGVVPPVAGFEVLNPLLETDGSPLRVPTRPGVWDGPAGPRRAGVSSFGIGGTNAHAIIEQAPDSETVPAADAAGVDRTARERLVLLSAATPDALDRSAERLAAHLSETAPDLTDVAHTLAAGRAELPRRLAVSGRDPAEIAERLTGGARVARGSSPVTGPAPVVFLLPGQGTQRPGMALPFAEELPGFSVALDTCLEAFVPEQAARMRGALLDPGFPAPELEATELAQPALFALGHAAATALTGLGVSPAALIGHSLGEITAACLAGVLGLADAARFVTARGRAMQGCPPGAMAALGCGAARATKLLAQYGGTLELAAVNGPDDVVVAGPADEVDAFRAWLGDRASSRPLRTSHAFHSALVEPAVPELLAALSGVRLGRPTVPTASNVTGRIVPAGAEIVPGAFAEQARRTVRFADALAEAAELFPGAVAVEVGSGRALSAAAEAAGLRTVALSSARSGHSGEGPLAALGALWTLGQPLDVAALCGEGRRVRLPGYPFAGPSRIAPEALAGTTGRAGTRTGAATRPQEPGTTSPAPVATGVRGGRNTDGTDDVHDTVVRAWTQFLGASALTDDSDFFDLGGDSLLITRVTSRLSEDLGIDIPVRSMLVARTLGGQATLLKGLLAAGAPEPAETDYLEVNRALWDERVPIHVGSDHYDVDGFRRGADPIREFELSEVGDVAGLRLAHLQCHIGLDTLAWARRGARVTGLDFSAPAIEQARKFAAELGLDARFETADVYESEARLGSRAYDIVYTGVGALCWLPDIRKWAETVVSLLAPGGFLYLSEFHPFADTLGYDGRTVVHDYFDSGPQISDMSGTYADTEASTENSRAVAFQHGLGEVVSALVSAGLRIDFLHEHDMTIFQKFHSLSAHADGVYTTADGKPRVPLMYSLRATLDDRRGEAL